MNDLIPKELMQYWISMAPGAFHVSFLSNKIDNQQVYTEMFEKFVDEGVLDRHGDKRGWYIPRQVVLERIDYKTADDSPIDIWLPFGLSDKVELYENSVVIVSGAPNAGKTAILLNILRFNQQKEWDLHYFSSEMSGGELKKRLLKFYPEVGLEYWTFNAYNRAERFADVIFPGKNSINIIDFLEVHDEFYIIGRRIKEIHDRLNGGIAIIAIQKNPGSDTGLGGFRTMEVARLALAIDYGMVKVTKAKNWRDSKYNPNNKCKDFKIIDGCKIIETSKWYTVQKNGNHEKE